VYVWCVRTGAVDDRGNCADLCLLQVFGGKLELLEDDKNSKEALLKQHSVAIQDESDSRSAFVELTFFRRPDNLRVNIFLCAGTRRSDEGISGVVYFVQDVSTRQEAERLYKVKVAEEAANRAKLEHLQFLCHEIRNPLNGILGNVSFMLDSDIDEEQALLVEGTYDRAKQLREVVDDVLDVSKINMGAVELEKLSFDVVSLLNTMIHSTNEVDHWGQIMNVTKACAYPKVLGDAFRIQQILNKFIAFCSHNPFQETVYRSAVVCVSVDCQEPQMKKGALMSKYTFRVTNESLQIPSSDIEHMFGDVTVGETGMLRMTVCKKLAVLMGGDVRCQSSPNTGTIFTLSLELEHMGKGNEEKLNHVLGTSTRTSRPVRVVDPDLSAKLDSYLNKRVDSCSPTRSPRRNQNSNSFKIKLSSPVAQLDVVPQSLSDTETSKSEQDRSARYMKSTRHIDTTSKANSRSFRRMPSEPGAWGSRNIDPNEKWVQSQASMVQQQQLQAKIQHQSSTRSARQISHDNSNKSNISMRSVSMTSTLPPWTQMECYRLPSKDYAFECVREVCEGSVVAVLGSLTVQGMTRQAWGTASFEQDGDQAMTKASRRAMHKAAQSFGTYSGATTKVIERARARVSGNNSAHSSARIFLKSPNVTSQNMGVGVPKVQEDDSSKLVQNRTKVAHDPSPLDSSQQAADSVVPPCKKEAGAQETEAGAQEKEAGGIESKSSAQGMIRVGSRESNMRRNNSESSNFSLGSAGEDPAALDKNVLIVDDESINTRLVSSALKKYGFNCTCVSDGTEVLCRQPICTWLACFFSRPCVLASLLRSPLACWLLCSPQAFALATFWSK
jgi:signal transduction histidine kinase